MSGLVIRDKNGENISYSGSQYEGLENVGNKHLCIRTGAGSSDIKKYGLTSTPLNDKYKLLKIKISSEANGKYAYIAQRYEDTQQETIIDNYTTTSVSNYATTTSRPVTSTTRQATYTTTSVSNYINSVTVTNASSLKLSTKTTTRVSYTNDTGTFYGSNPVTSTGLYPHSISTNRNNKFIFYDISSNNDKNFAVGNFIDANNYTGPGTNISDTYLKTRWNGMVGNGTVPVFVSDNKTFYKMSLTFEDCASVTRGVGSTVNTYTSSTTLFTESSTKLVTNIATRPSNPYNTSSIQPVASTTSATNTNLTRPSNSYTTSSSTLTTKVITSHNVDL